MSQDVTDHHFQIKCIPMESGFQHCLSMKCETDPYAALTEIEDGFGNKGFYGVITKEHSRLCIKAEGTVDVGGTRYLQPLPPMYKFQSAMTHPGRELDAFYKSIAADLPTDVSGDKKALFIMDRLFERYGYAAGVTDVNTTAEDAFALGRGVCQDYAHILISLLRTAKIPARYVAGLLIGEGATHAWVEAWTGDTWTGLDPTHDRVVDDTYIKLTHGRDFHDGAVDKGHFTGCALQSQQIYVKVEEILDPGKSL